MSNPECDLCGSNCLNLASDLIYCCICQCLEPSELCKECFDSFDPGAEVSSIAKPEIIDQNFISGIAYTRFKCGCETEDNRKRLLNVSKNCGRHVSMELQQAVGI